MASTSSDVGIPQCQISPSFLHTNSTSHTWAFSAIAELVDNAYDPDVHATDFWIDVEHINGKTCLTFVDNGSGLNQEGLLKMLSFGFCDKDVYNARGYHAPIGAYGNGFKSGSMRLGKDAMVMTLQGPTVSVGLLSQTYLEEVQAEPVLVPIVSWKLPQRRCCETSDATKKSLEAILTHSIFRREEELLEQVKQLKKNSQTTKIIIYNLRRSQNNVPELDLYSDPADIRISQEFDGSTAPEFRKSLREYLSVLYLKPRMKIYIKGEKVKTKLIAKSLARTEIDVYRPTWLEKPVKITFGFTCSQWQEEDYGMMMYHRNRLIKAYEKVGYKKQPTGQGVGVVGVVEVDFLQTIHNKQDFERDEKYTSLMTALALKAKDYWNEKTKRDPLASTSSGSSSGPEPDWLWAQCDQCRKWRRLPEGITSDSLPKKWFCEMNPDTTHNRCNIEEEPEDEKKVLKRATYSKTYKKEQRRVKEEQKVLKLLEQLDEEPQQKEQLEEKQEQQKQQQGKQQGKQQKQQRQQQRKQQGQQQKELKQQGQQPQQQKQQRKQQGQQQKQQQQQQKQSHRLDVNRGAPAIQINLLQEKMKQRRLQQEAESRRKEEEEHLHTEQNVPERPTCRNLKRSVPREQTGASASKVARKQICLTTQPSLEPTLEDLADNDMEEEGREAGGSALEDVKPIKQELDKATKVVPALTPSTSSGSSHSRGISLKKMQLTVKLKKDLAEREEMLAEKTAELEETQDKVRSLEEELSRARSLEEELSRAREEVASSKSRTSEAQEKLRSLQELAHQLLSIILPDTNMGDPDTVDASIREVLQVQSELSDEPA